MHLGIDLGTTNSAVGIMLDDGVEIFKNDRGNLITPSVVYYEQDGEVRVGEQAAEMLGARDDRVVESIKRHMDETGYTVEIDGEEYTPVDVSAEILRKMRSISDGPLDDVPDEAVVTVPAYFKDTAKTQTREAAKQAGLDVKLLNEPEAAAVAYGHEQGLDELLLVYDFGGGTLDISIIEVDDNVYETKHVGGDMELGGQDLDEALADHIVNEYEAQEGIDIRQDEQIYGELRREAERAKKSLSSEDSVEIIAPTLGQIDGELVGINREITRDEFENVVSDLLDQAREPLEEAMDEEGLDTGDLDQVLLVGGSTRIPAIQELVEETTGVEPQLDIAPDRAVGIGASIVDYDSIGAPDDIDDPDHPDDDNTPRIKSAVARSIGVKTENEDGDVVIDHLLEKNTPESEATASEIYTTTRDDQTSVDIEIYIGESTDPDEAELLGEGTLDGIKPAPAGEPSIEVSFEIEDKTLTAIADDLDDPDNDITIDIDRDVVT